MTNKVKGDERAYYRALRDAASERGDKTYLGHPCQNGHIGKRYVNGKGQCVDCATNWKRKSSPKRPWKRNRQVAQDLAVKTYDGRPCKHGHAGRRYTNSGGCVACSNISAKARYKKVGTTDRAREQQKSWQLANKPKAMWLAARNRAIKDGREFNIEVDDIVVPDTCPVLGIPIQFGGAKWNSPSLDRIDNTKGYVKGNVAVISNRANTIKNNATVEELQMIVSYMQRSLVSENDNAGTLKLVA